MLATFLGSLGRFPALSKISHVQNHGLQPRLFGQNRPISAHCKLLPKTSRTSLYALTNHLQAYLRRFQGVWADFQHLPKSAMFKTMGYSPGFLVKIGRFRLIENSPENFTNKSLRTQKSICKHSGDILMEFGPISSTCQNSPCSKPWATAHTFWSKSTDFVSLQILPKTSRTSLYALTNSFASMLTTFLREFWPIYSTYQNPPTSKPWAIAQAFSSKWADFGSLQIFRKTSRTSLYALRNPFASMLATFLGSLGRFPALTKISHVQNHGPRLFGENRPISAHCKFSGKLHEQVFTHLEIHLQACWRRFQGVWADFQHLPKSGIFKTMAIAQDSSSKSADFVSLKILPKTSQRSLYALSNPFASIFATF